MKAYKGFDKDLKCRGFQYEIGKEYEEKGASLCNKGFHAKDMSIDEMAEWLYANCEWLSAEYGDCSGARDSRRMLEFLNSGGDTE